MTGLLIGVDEVGLGAWAGPLVVCAVAVPRLWVPPVGLDDSKKLKDPKRSRVYNELISRLDDSASVLFAVTNNIIDQVGLRRSMVDAHTRAVNALLQRFSAVEEIIVDGVVPLPGVPRARCVAHADGIYPVVMAASVIAKCSRDALMRGYHQQYPVYGWNSNVGYGTRQHQEGIAKEGISPLHRQSIAPIRKLLE